MTGFNALRSVPSYISTEDASVKVAQVEEALSLVISPKDYKTKAYKTMQQFSDTVHKHIALGNPTATFGNKSIHEMLEVQDWICLPYTIISTRQNSKLLNEYMMQLLDALENKLTRAGAFASTKDWTQFVKNAYPRQVHKCLPMFLDRLKHICL